MRIYADFYVTSTLMARAQSVVHGAEGSQDLVGDVFMDQHDDSLSCWLPGKVNCNLALRCFMHKADFRDTDSR